MAAQMADPLGGSGGRGGECAVLVGGGGVCGCEDCYACFGFVCCLLSSLRAGLTWVCIVAFLIAVAGRQTLQPVDVAELERLKYGYKGA